VDEIRSTRGMFVGCKGATWPNHGLPRGTPGLANEGYVKIFLGPGGFEPRTSPCQRLNKASRPLDHACDLLCNAAEYVFKFVLLLAGGSGRGLAPTPVYCCTYDPRRYGGARVI
jgi:hypothetical protein